MSSTSSTPAPTVRPTLQAENALALVEFLVDTVGFVKTALYADGDQVAHAQLDWPEGGGIMLGLHKPGHDWSREPGTAGTYVVTDDPDRLYGRLRAAGVEIVRELEDQEYGNREFSIRDPEGNLWSFGYYRGQPRAYGSHPPHRAQNGQEIDLRVHPLGMCQRLRGARTVADVGFTRWPTGRG